MPILSASHVSKSFHDVPVFTDASFVLEKGRAYGLVGPNGSGKSVLLRLLVGFLLPDSGTVTVDPRYLSKRRTFPDRFGVAIDGPGYLPFDTGYENLRRLAVIRDRIGQSEIRATMEMLGLSPDARQQVRRYSLGMKQKLSLAQALMEDPEVLILDEPFNGLDADSVAVVRSILRERVAAGATLVFTSHNRDDIDEVADDILEIAGGRVTQKGALP